MAFTDDNTIMLNVGADSPYVEAYAGEDLMPGHFLMQIYVLKDLLYKSTNFGAPTEKLIAVENVYKGGGIGTEYLDGTRVMARICRSGDMVLAWRSVSSLTMPIGAILCVDGYGAVLEIGEVTTPQPGSVVAVSLENLTAPQVGESVLMRIRIL